MKLDRRGFLKSFGAAIAVAIVAPVVPAAAPVLVVPAAAPVLDDGNWIDLANAFAFTSVAEFQRDFHGPRNGPRNERFYRDRALVAAHRYMQSRRA